MKRGLRVALLVLPWLLVAGLAFAAWLSWVHFQWKDRSLWERMLTDTIETPAGIELLRLGETAEVLEALEQRLVEDCRLIREEAHLAPPRVETQLQRALDTCARYEPVR
ncbi:MAG: hypothetical protein ACXIUZ_12780 [Lysobacteraceae bacterium]